MREKLAEQANVSFALCEEDKTDIRKLMDVHREDNAYFAKNLFRIAVDRHNGFGDGVPPAIATPSFTASTILSIFMCPGTISL